MREREQVKAALATASAQLDRLIRVTPEGEEREALAEAMMLLSTVRGIVDEVA